MGKTNRRDFLKAFGLGAVTAVGVVGYEVETNQHVEVSERKLNLPRWDASGFRLAIISDLHVDSPEATTRAQSAIRETMRLRPDALAIVGDFLTSAAPQNLENVRNTLACLNDFDIPSFGVLGNHDYWAGYFPLVHRAITQSRMLLLRNETIEVGGIRLCGIDDALMKKHRPEAAKADKNTVVLLHEPDFVEDLEPGPSLLVGGHSHGGQICLPGGFALHTPRGARKFVSGFYEDQPIPVYVSRGIGTTGPNWRMFCPPEATILELRGS